MDISYFYRTTLCIVFVGQASALQASITLGGDNVIGGNVTITCGWTIAANERLSNVIISPGPVNGPEIYYYKIRKDGDVLVNATIRFSLDNTYNSSGVQYVNLSSQSVTMRISNVQCVDEHNYFCIVTGYVLGAPDNTVSQSQNLVVKARPKIPNQIVTPDITNGVLENTEINVTCSANVGRPGLGTLQWKIIRNNIPEPGNTWIVDTRNVSVAQPTEESCTQLVIQTFKMQVTKDFQGMVVACFVQNNDFQTQVPERCENPFTDLCRQTVPIRILYGVNETTMRISRDPPDNIYQGESVTLKCEADSFPAANYTWVKVDSGNGTVVGQNNTYKLTSLEYNGNQEQNYNCIASNAVFEKEYSATKGLSFTVLTTTTTRTTTTTTPTTTLVTINNGTSGGKEPQTKDDDDHKTTIIIVVVVVGTCLIIAIVVGVICWRKRARKEIEEPSEKPYNSNRTNPSYQSSQPDLVADKTMHNSNLDIRNNKSSLNGSIPSFNEKQEDGLMYAEMTYDNKPRSRKPMAINDSSSDYSDIHMPQI